MLLLGIAAAAALQPQPSDLHLFRDWIVGCDNGRACQAVALMPEDRWDGALTMVVQRGPEADARAIIVIVDPAEPLSGPATLVADGKATAIRFEARDENFAVAAADVPLALGILRSARTLELRQDGKPARILSPLGATAAMLFMDEAQRRLGTPTALVRQGGRRFDAPSPALPEIRAAAMVGAPLSLSAGEVAALRRREGCLIEEVGGPDDIEIHALDGERSLILLACGSTAYNLTQIPFLASRANGTLSMTDAPFDRPPVWGEPGSRPALVNASFEDGILSDYAKGRGIGDCGVASQYVWDGALFRLTRQAEMTECRGSYEYIVTWRATVVR